MGNFLQDLIIGEITDRSMNALQKSGLGEHQINIIKEIAPVHQFTQAEQIFNGLMGQSPLGITNEGRIATHFHIEAIEHMDDRGIAGFEQDTIRIGRQNFTVSVDASGLAYGQQSDTRNSGDTSNLSQDELDELRDFRREVEARAAAEMAPHVASEGAAAAYRSGLEGYIENDLGREYAASQQSASLDTSGPETQGPLTAGGGDQEYIEIASADGLDVGANAMPAGVAADVGMQTSTPAAFTV